MCENCTCDYEFIADTMFVDLCSIDDEDIWKIVLMDMRTGKCESHYFDFVDAACEAEKLAEVIFISIMEDSIQVFYDEEICNEFIDHVKNHLKELDFIVVDDDWVVRLICPECGERCHIINNNIEHIDE